MTDSLASLLALYDDPAPLAEAATTPAAWYVRAEMAMGVDRCKMVFNVYSADVSADKEEARRAGNSFTGYWRGL